MAKFIIEVEIDTDPTTPIPTLECVLAVVQKAVEREVPDWNPVVRYKQYAQGRTLGYPDSI